MKRHFLFLQGPLSSFFFHLGKALRDLGCAVSRIQFCGGDCFFWPSFAAHMWQGSLLDWPGYIGSFFETHGITDLVLLGDWRPLHREAVLVAKKRRARVWVFEEGYLRPGFVTLEEGGVNVTSSLPKDPQGIRARARELENREPLLGSKQPNPISLRVATTAWHHVGNFFLWPLFFRYRTHRPYCIGRELLGHIPRYLTRRKRRMDSIALCRKVLRSGAPFFFVPLQLDSDAQIRRNSPFSGVLEFLAEVVFDFARNAAPESCLLLKNHPLDNGVLNYKRYLISLGLAAGCLERMSFVEGVGNGPLLDACRGVVLCNSTLGISALEQNRAVYCLGEAIYAMEGLAVDRRQMSLKEFWNNPSCPDPSLVQDFLSVVRNDALLAGNFYTKEGQREVIREALQRMGVDHGA